VSGFRFQPTDGAGRKAENICREAGMLGGWEAEKKMTLRSQEVEKMRRYRLKPSSFPASQPLTLYLIPYT
jgi:hypothetical protein